MTSTKPFSSYAAPVMLVRKLTYTVLSLPTIKMLGFDLLRFRIRMRQHRHSQLLPAATRLHLGCGKRRFQGWLNVDLVGSDYDLDLSVGWLPWQPASFEAVVSQHFIEHLDLHSELFPLLYEIRRVLRPGGEIWLSCPDMEKLCRSYIDHQMQDLLEVRTQRKPGYSLRGAPSSQLLNEFFYQHGDHRNLYDFPLLQWVLTQSGFSAVQRVSETDLLRRFPEISTRNDDMQALYVMAVVEKE